MYKLGFPGQQFCVNDGLHPSQVYQGLCGEYCSCLLGEGREWHNIAWCVKCPLVCNRGCLGLSLFYHATLTYLCPSLSPPQNATPWASPGPAATPSCTRQVPPCQTASPTATLWCRRRLPQPITTTWSCRPPTPWCPQGSTWTTRTTTLWGPQISWWKGFTSPSWASWRSSTHGK